MCSAATADFNKPDDDNHVSKYTFFLLAWRRLVDLPYVITHQLFMKCTKKGFKYQSIYLRQLHLFVDIYICSELYIIRLGTFVNLVPF